VEWILFGNESESEIETKKNSAELLGIFKLRKTKKTIILSSFAKHPSLNFQV